MIGSRRRSRSTTNVWPGYVDALSALLMLVIFMLLVYVVSQLFLSQTLSDRNSELAQLNQRLSEISQLLGLEQGTTAALEQQMLMVQNSFSDSLAQNEDLQQRLEASRDQLMRQTADAEARAESLASMNQDLDNKDELSNSQQNMIMRLSNQIASLQNQLRQITTALKLQREMTVGKENELENVSRRLNTLLAERINQLEQYQSEFFARLRNILAANENIRIVGDRFLLPSELLFASGSALLGAEGKRELDKLAGVLLDVVETIPADLEWILRIDGHTDRIPINTPQFPSNWELSTARAVAVVRYLADQSVPQNRMVAAGFGEFFPVADGTTPDALQANRRIEIKLTDR
ncbi:MULTISPECIES: peptidoglycan -binding protein [unclassified Marinobacter]|uniref:peptidoglycan -binding protein n=1 Tax=unclassified Marinobacter TaxID=83889 RepID=UPI00200E3927|nr:MULTISPECIES: peptidoglycan -binding protein [unclassified Marinobacter]MCL1484932.1 peptidoglycan -binding protein [Marinobacter sp.]UQG56409.1 peptidoglycan -binding protein [Marinobacter sp. M4C]UQG65213.1 peptidoglycan -binding protein [Marinobacter sp. M2C]UQG69492.1 peptidoglycan -binding protein [Marinobacter sp. M1C]